VPQAATPQQQNQQRGARGRRVSAGNANTAMNVSLEELMRNAGKFEQMAFSAVGSSFLQAALRRHPPALRAVHTELAPVMPMMLLDDNACYVAKAVLELSPIEMAHTLIASVGHDDDFMTRLMTGSLHTRRMVQFFIESVGPDALDYIVPAMQRNLLTVARTKEGCVTIQRTLDALGSGDREFTYDIVRRNIADFIVDQHACYVVQYMLQNGDSQANVAALRTDAAVRGFVTVVCHKHTSTVLEKAIAAGNHHIHSWLVGELSMIDDAQLCAVVNDAFANYVVQAIISKASPDHVAALAIRVQPVAGKLQFGHKLHQRIARRLNNPAERR